MKARREMRWLACAALLLALPAAAAAPPAATKSTVPPLDATRPAGSAPEERVPAALPPDTEPPIPVADVAARAELAAAVMRNLAPEIEARTALDKVEARLHDNAATLWTAADDTRMVLEEGPRLTVLDDLEAQWREGRTELAKQNGALTLRAREADAALDEVKKSRERWARTEVAARDSDAPQQVLSRIQQTTTEIDRAREQLLALRERILTAQDQAARQVAISDEVLATIDQHRRDAVEQLGTPTSRPLWQARLGDRDHGTVTSRLARETTQELRRSLDFVGRRASVFQLQILGFAVLVFLFRAARRRAATWAQREPVLRDAAQALRYPYSAAAVLTLLSSLYLHPGLPRILVQITAVLSFVPVLRIVLRLVHPGLIWLVYTFAGFFFVDRVRDFVAPAPLLEQFLMSVEMASGLALMIWLLWPGSLRGVELTPEDARRLRLLSWAGRILAVFFFGALVASVSGYMQVARILCSASLGAVYVAMALYAAVRAARGLVAFLLRAPPLADLRSVQHHRDLLEERTDRVMVWAGCLLWAYAVGRNLAFFGLSGSADEVLAANVSFGSITISVGDVAGLGITIYAAFLLSRFVRFVLGEEVFPRLELAHGVPYAISSLLHYAILLGGFLLALAAMGLDLNRFTVLGGAFGVGIGFGLQTIVNNFVSGLILLFERPIQLGDTVQVSDITGEVKRIGIRSSTIRTSSGAEVIVPNSALIAERVTNWTLSDRSRRFEIAVGVAYGTRPAVVIETLTEVARKHPEVLSRPEPTALFLRFGDSSIDFELRAWVVDGDRIGVVKTDVAVALTEAFEAAGIEIPFPQREIRVATPATPAGG